MCDGQNTFNSSYNFDNDLGSEQDTHYDNFDDSEFKNPQSNIYSIVLDYCKESYYATCDGNCDFKRGDLVVAQTRYGVDVVRIAGLVRNLPAYIKQKDLVCINRLASEAEVAIFTENEEKVFRCNEIFKEKVRDNQLDMRLVTSHILVPEPKIIFFFNADTRIDFRKLVKDLVSVFRLRVELRQIAARDESKISGGIGQCGRPFCCCYFTDKPPNVSSKMARDQKFSLISQKASGPCGRLMCCLSFEHNWYLCERWRFPPKGFKFSAAGKNFVVIDINMVMESIIISDSQERIFKVSPDNFRYEDNTWIPDLNYFENLD